MIVRIMGEGQYRLEGDAVGRLNELDDRAQEALERDNEGELDRYLAEMASCIRREGESLPDDDLSPSDAIVPPTDMTLAEAKLFFSDEGLIPDVSP